MGAGRDRGTLLFYVAGALCPEHGTVSMLPLGEECCHLLASRPDTSVNEIPREPMKSCPFVVYVRVAKVT